MPSQLMWSASCVGREVVEGPPSSASWLHQDVAVLGVDAHHVVRKKVLDLLGEQVESGVDGWRKAESGEVLMEAERQ